LTSTHNKNHVGRSNWGCSPTRPPKHNKKVNSKGLVEQRTLRVPQTRKRSEQWGKKEPSTKKQKIRKAARKRGGRKGSHKHCVNRKTGTTTKKRRAIGDQRVRVGAQRRGRSQHCGQNNNVQTRRARRGKGVQATCRCSRGGVRSVRGKTQQSRRKQRLVKGYHSC